MVSYEEGLQTVKKGFLILCVVTAVEVLFALLGNGHIVPGLMFPKLVMAPVMIAFSLYKAYYIVYNFMHMAHEVKGLAMSVLLPMLLLVWGVIAFMQEGKFWGSRRTQIEQFNAKGVKAATSKSTGMLDDIKQLPTKNG